MQMPNKRSLHGAVSVAAILLLTGLAVLSVGDVVAERADRVFPAGAR